MSSSDALWAEAFARLRSKLTAKDVKRMRAESFETLKKHIQTERRMYKDRTVPKLLDRLEPFFGRLRTFSGALDTFAQAHDVLCLLWGSLRIVLEVGILPRMLLCLANHPPLGHVSRVSLS